MRTLIINLVKTAETKNYIRYGLADPDEVAHVTSLYIHKSAFLGGEVATEIQLTVEAVDQ